MHAVPEPSARCGELIKRDGLRKKELESTKEPFKSQEQRSEVDKSEKDIIGDELKTV